MYMYVYGDIYVYIDIHKNTSKCIHMYICIYIYIHIDDPNDIRYSLYG
jgi:hypothetical protein